VNDLKEVGALEEDEADIEEIVELNTVQCSSNISQFKSSVVVALDGNVEGLNNTEKTALEKAFVDSYNDLSLTKCDLYHRNVVAVKIIPASLVGSTAGGRRHLQTVANGTSGVPMIGSTETSQVGSGPANGNTTTSSSPTSNVALYEVIAECRECPVTDSGTFDLFDQGFRRSLLQQSFLKPRFDFQGRKLQNPPSSECICPIELEPIEADAPTEDEFLAGYSTAVTQLNEEGIVTSVTGVKGIEACPREVREISGIYGLTFKSSDMNGLSEIETADFVIDSFNSLRVDACNSQVIEVFLQNDVTRRKYPSSRQQASIGELQIEVVSLSEQSQKMGVFSSEGYRKIDFLFQLNQFFAEVGAAAIADSVDYLGPAVECSENRATYSVLLYIDFQSIEALACPIVDDDNDNIGDDDDASLNFDGKLFCSIGLLAFFRCSSTMVFYCFWEHKIRHEFHIFLFCV